MTDVRVIRSTANLRAALLEMLQSQPFDRITIRDVAARAGVGYTTYFRHYASKEALLDDVAAEEIARLCEYTLPIYDAIDSYAACRALCAFIDGQRSLWMTLLTGGAASSVREELIGRARVASSDRSGQGWLPADLGAILVVSVMVELMVWWLRQSDPLPVDEVAEILDRIAISPAKSSGAPLRSRARAKG